MATSGKSLAWLALWAATLSGCGPDAPPLDPTPGETRVVYSCEGGRDFAATFHTGRSMVQLEVEGAVMELPQIPSASGIAYSDGKVTFRAKGLDAFTQGWPGGDFTNCTGTNT
jgi:membrane-bound inhibitor of C-type lysozyme